MKLLIIDRDGVLLPDPDGRTVRTLDWHPRPDSAEALARLAHGGWRIAMMADCGPLERGTCDMVALNALHARLIEAIATAGGRIDAVVFVPAAESPQRRARTTDALEDLVCRLGATAADTLVVADSRAGLEAAADAGCRPVLVLSGHGRATLEAGELPVGARVRVDLAALVTELVP